MPIPVNQPGAQPQRNTRAANMNPMGYKTPSTPPTIGPGNQPRSYNHRYIDNSPAAAYAGQQANGAAALPGIGMTMEEMLAMFQQLMAQQQGSANPVGVGPSSKAPLDPPSYTPPMQAPGRLAPPASSPISPLTPTTPSYMDSPPPPPKVGNQSVPGMPAPQLSAITEMMKNTQGNPAQRNSSPNVAQAFGPRNVRR